MRAKYVVTIGDIPPFASDRVDSILETEIDDALRSAGMRVIRVARRGTPEPKRKGLIDNPSMEVSGNGWRASTWGAPVRPHSPPKPESTAGIYDQDYWWRSNAGWVAISDMEPSHVANTVAWMDRNAESVALRIAMAPSGWPDPAEMSDGVFASYFASENKIDDMVEAPHAWMRGTKLYRKLAQVEADNLDRESHQARIGRIRQHREDSLAQAEEHTWD